MADSVLSLGFAHPALKGAAGALGRAGTLPFLQSPSGYTTNPGRKALRALLICIGLCFSKGFPCCLPASPEAWRAAFREALGSAPNEKDRSGEEMEARENFEPRGCWWVTKQWRGSSMVRYSENSAQRWQSKHDILSFTVIWERCCFPQVWAWDESAIPGQVSPKLTTHLFSAQGNMAENRRREKIHQKKLTKITLNYPGGCAGSTPVCWDQGRKPLLAHGGETLI